MTWLVANPSMALATGIRERAEALYEIAARSAASCAFEPNRIV